MKLVCQESGFGGLGLTPSSFRPGGATARFLNGETVERLQYAGRWKNVATLRSYIQEAATVLAWSKVAPLVQARIVALNESCSSLINEPPRVPWYQALPAWRTTTPVKRS